MDKCIYIISDSLGETAEKVAKAALGQFEESNCNIVKHSFVDTPDQVNEIMYEAKHAKAMVIFTTVIEAVRKEIISRCEVYDLAYIDLMTPVLEKMEDHFEMKPMKKPGIIHKMDVFYFNRVEAIEFAVKYDDGKDPRGVRKADIVLLGVSRTSKTPLSMYLAHKSIKVANIPLVPELPVPPEVYEINPRKIIGLTNDPDKLNAIREERLRSMGLKQNSSYSDMNRIDEELRYAEKIFKRLGCPVINVASRAIEETANLIVDIHKKNQEQK